MTKVKKSCWMSFWKALRRVMGDQWSGLVGLLDDTTCHFLKWAKWAPKPFFRHVLWHLIVETDPTASAVFCKEPRREREDLSVLCWVCNDPPNESCRGKNAVSLLQEYVQTSKRLLTLLGNEKSQVFVGVQQNQVGWWFQMFFSFFF